MRLSNREFKAMNNPFRQLLQRRVEFPQFQRMGLIDQRQDILEIGCGSGYGAVLLTALNPKSYVGVDMMPEQIELAQKRQLANAEFVLQDATDLRDIADSSKDVIVIFGVLHHISPWRDVVSECYRVLRPGGKMFIEEPDARILSTWDRVFHWGHPDAFQLKAFEAHAQAIGFTICKRRWMMGLGVYCLQK